MRTLVSYILYLVNAVIIAAYGIGSLAPYITPATTTIPAYFGLAYPALWAAMIITLIIDLLSRRWQPAIIITITLALTLPLWRKTINIPHPDTTTHTTDTNQHQLKILTYNVGIFNANRDLDRFIDFIRDTDADIVCLQEFGFYRRASSQTEILHHFDSIYPYRHLWYKNQSPHISSGLATFSRYPIIKKEKIQYRSEHNVSIYSDIRIGTDTIRIINNHLESNHLTHSDRDLSTLLDDSTTRTEIARHSRTLHTKLGTAMTIRASQAEAIRYTISRTPHPVIVLGDFNDVPQSYTYRIIATHLTDAYTTAGHYGYYWTFNQPPMLFPIDHILHTPTLRTTHAHIHHIPLSDHYPLTATITIPK